MLPQVVATPHIAASTREGQELVGVETATALRDFLKTSIFRNAVNFPSVAPDEFQRLQPYITLARQLGCLLGQTGDARIEGVSVRYYGELARAANPLIVSAVLVGLFRAILSESVTPVNAMAVATGRGMEITESQSSRNRNYSSLISIKLRTSAGDRWVEGTVVRGEARLVNLNGVSIEAPLEGTMLLMMNNDQPGVIGAVGTILGRHHINIASFALGRTPDGAVGVVNIDDANGAGLPKGIVEEIRAANGVNEVWVARV